MSKVLCSAMVAGSILCVWQTATGPPASALDRQVELTNNTRVAIIEVYASPAGTGRWEQDLLGADILAPNGSTIVYIGDGIGFCRFDFKTVFDDGTILIRRDVDVCAAKRYAISSR